MGVWTEESVLDLPAVERAAADEAGAAVAVRNRVAKRTLEADEIRQLLPHRWPLILVDRVTELRPGLSATGIKNVTSNEPFFPGHFPMKAIMPGVLIIEALAQLGGIVAAFVEGSDEPTGPAARGYLAGVRRVRFKRLVRPGDQLQMTVERQASGAGVIDFRAEARVDRQVVADGNLMLAL